MTKRSVVEEIAEAPAVAVEKTVELSEQAVKAVSGQKSLQTAKKYWELLGPGLVTGGADDDNSGVATYSQTGSRYGFQLAWLSVFTFPLMGLVQEMCARIGLVTGRGLAANIKLFFPRWVLYVCTFLLLAANSFNIGADLGALAESARLIRPEWSYAALVIGFAVLCLALQIFFNYRSYSRYLKYLTLLLFAYVLTAFFIKDLNWVAVLKSAISPSLSLDKEQIVLICAILGTTISPYLFFWQTSQEVEESIEQNGTRKATGPVTDIQIKNMRIDNWSGMFLSNLVMFFIIVVSGAVLFKNGITDINTAADAAAALRPLAGQWAYWLFALGMFGVGLLAIPILAGSASYAISESFGWKEGLHRKLKEAYAFYGVIIISMLLGVIMNFVGLNPIKALIYAAVANGLIAPIVLLLIVLLSSNRNVMANRANSRLTKFFGFVVVAIMTVAGLATIWALWG